MGQYQDNLFLKRKLRERLERQLRDDAIPASAISAELVTGYRGIYNRVFKRWLDFVLALALFVVTLPVLAAFHAEVGKPASLHLSGGVCDVMVQTADPCPPAHKRMEETRIAASLRKTGGTVFAIKEVKVCQIKS